MTQEIINRLKELLAKASADPDKLSGVRCPHGWDRTVCPMKGCGNGIEEARDELFEILPALLSTLTNLTPSEGAERQADDATQAEDYRYLFSIAQQLSYPSVLEALEALALPSEPPSQDWRCVSCKRVVRSATEPEQCDCLGRTFAKIDTPPPSQGDVEGRARLDPVRLIEALEAIEVASWRYAGDDRGPGVSEAALVAAIASALEHAGMSEAEGRYAFDTDEREAILSQSKGRS